MLTFTFHLFQIFGIIGSVGSVNETERILSAPARAARIVRPVRSFFRSEYLVYRVPHTITMPTAILLGVPLKRIESKQ